MEVLVGDKVIAEGRHVRRGAAGEAALTLAIENVIKSRAKVAPRSSAKPPAEQGWEIVHAPTDREISGLAAISAEWSKGKDTTATLRLVATGFHSDGSWSMEARLGEKIVGRCRHADREHAGVIALQEAASQLLGAPRPTQATAPAAFSQGSPLVVQKKVATPHAHATAGPVAAASAATATAHGGLMASAPIGGGEDGKTFAPRQSSALHGISVVDSKNMSKSEEDLMRQLMALATTARVAPPKLRAVKHDGAGWTMEVLADSDVVIAKGQNAKRGVAGEQALTEALKNFPGYLARSTRQPTPAVRTQPPPTPAVAVAVPTQQGPPSNAPSGPAANTVDSTSAAKGEARESRADTQRWSMLQELCSRLHPDGLASLKPKMRQLDQTHE
jgi:hypothetical protein